MGNMILNSKERKQLFGRLETQWGIAVPDAMREQAWLKSGERYYLAGRSLEQLPGLRLERLRIYTLSEHDGALRLSVEGSQLLGPYAKKNVVELSPELAHRWLKGESLEIQAEAAGFVFVRSGKDYLGCGRYAGGKLPNFVPKERRLSAHAEPF